jgi:murein DD-endopeptidase MepM/ murein hydrolase activator NlpD
VSARYASAFIALLLFAPALTATASAGTLSLDGPLVQGGLMIGATNPGARATLDGNPVRVDSAGTFLIGFGRDAAASARLLIEHPDGSRTERELKVAARTYPVQRIDGLPERQVTPPPEDMARIKDDSLLISEVRRLDSDRRGFASGFAWPAEGQVSGVFGSQRILNGKPRRPHSGVDVVAPIGAPVVACADGVVALVHQDMFFTGKTVLIDHGHGLVSAYAHLDDIRVRPGERIAKGARIGSIGRTGRVTGPHLHWGVSLFGTHLDPALLVGPMEAQSGVEPGRSSGVR